MTENIYVVRDNLHSERPPFVLSMLESTWDGTTGEIIAIRFNDGRGYHQTDYGRQTREWLVEMNKKLGVSIVDQSAFEICSMNDGWKRYDHVLALCKENMLTKI